MGGAAVVEGGAAVVPEYSVSTGVTTQGDPSTPLHVALKPAAAVSPLLRRRMIPTVLAGMVKGPGAVFPQNSWSNPS